MKTASLNELNKELSTLPPKKVLELCIRLAKYKKESKELLTYLLFEADDEEAYIKGIKQETERQFLEMNKSNLYLAKKSLRKILRMINKFSKYSGLKQTDVELRIFYCMKLKESRIQIWESQVLINLFDSQLKKIRSSLAGLHEDLQFDFQKEIDELQSYLQIQ